MSYRPTNDLVLSVEGVSKCYQLYERPQYRLLQALWRRRRPYFTEVWALQKVSFQVARGEAVGIVGANGAGKSTLLQIVAGALTPTEGRVTAHKRIAALLQLGAGFHPEYTGRENVYLNGAILGITRADIDERFDRIAAFADIGAYMDRPVKTYSKGMHARLGFAVAISTDPEILIIDEVLAVGDLLFQQKCITRIRQMRSNGMTLLLASHSPARINGLCERGLLLRQGRQCFFGRTEECTNLYLAEMRTEVNQSQVEKPPKQHEERPIISRQSKGVMRYGTQDVRIIDVRVLNEEGDAARNFRFGEKIQVEVVYRSSITTDDLNVSYLIRDETGVDLTGTMTNDEGVTLPILHPNQTGRILFSFVNRFRPGNFGISVAVTKIDAREPRRPLLFDQIDGVEAFAVLPEPGRPVHYKFDSEVEVKIL